MNSTIEQQGAFYTQAFASMVHVFPEFCLLQYMYVLSASTCKLLVIFINTVLFCFMSLQTPSIALVQEVYGWGWLSWGNAGHTLGPTTLGSLVEIGIAQICCAEKCFLALTKTGKVYTCQYTAEGQVRATFILLLQVQLHVK